MMRLDGPLSLTAGDDNDATEQGTARMGNNGF